MQSETGFPSSHQLKSYVASKSRLKLAARAVLSADAGLLVRDHPGELVPEENLWTLWCKGRLTEAFSAKFIARCKRLLVNFTAMSNTLSRRQVA